jgi:hypothetical protein
MSGGWKQAKLAGRRPLDGRVRHMFEDRGQPLLDRDVARQLRSMEG